jgi:hypothetical protein
VKRRGPQGKQYSAEQLQWLEETSDANMAMFYRGTPHKKLPNAMRRRIIRLQREERKKMDGHAPGGHQNTPREGRSAPGARAPKLSAEEVKDR